MFRTNYGIAWWRNFNQVLSRPTHALFKLAHGTINMLTTVSLSMAKNENVKWTKEKYQIKWRKNETVKSQIASKRGQKKCVKHKRRAKIESKWKNVQLLLLMVLLVSAYMIQRWWRSIKSKTKRKRERKTSSDRLCFALFPFRLVYRLLKCRLQCE